MAVIDVFIAILLAADGLVTNLQGQAAVVHAGPLGLGAYPFVLAAARHPIRTLLLTLVETLPLACRRRFPLTVLWVATAATVAMHDTASPRVAFLSCLIGAYSAARYSPYRVPTLVSLVLVAALIGRYFTSALPDIPNALTSFVILIPTALAADAIRTGRQRADESRELLRVMEREQQETMRRAVEHERSRIARELHDVVTHNVSVMVVQAGAARKVMSVEPDAARDALLAVEASGRSAMSELRQVMGLLTPAEDGPAADPADALAPQPGVDRLDTLVERVRSAGTPVQLTVTGAARPLPAGIDLTAYRVVQEALTNTMKHAVGASARVVLDYGADSLRVTVTDTEGQPGRSAAQGNGRGLIGLRERLALYGGSLTAGGQPDGGYRVLAVLPLAGR
jgi:signal transduction histidine kinase